MKVKWKQKRYNFFFALILCCFFFELSLCPARDDREWQPRKKIYVWKISENKNI